MEQIFKKIVEHGTYYFPAWKHYNNSNANVVCDKCHENNLTASIGYDKYDLCLLCANQLSHQLFAIIKTKNELPQSNDVIMGLLEKWDHLGKNSSKMIYDYIIKVIKSPEFQTDRSSYLSNWQQRRGFTQELRIPEDPALEIIQKLTYY